ncbi:MAG: substrate-binding domain-containing protein, partial [Patescibacteria group bacterium]|nr:substrate-binding domain-containing protein [Patescibacteria group bacterium]
MTRARIRLVLCCVVTVCGADHEVFAQPLRLECGWNGIEACSSLITEFNERRNERAVKLRPRESNQVGPALAAGECFIGVVQDSLAPATVETLGHGFEALPLARFVVEVIVNASSPVRRVTADELDKIFRGQITSWRDVGGSRVDHRIELYSLRPARPETYIFRKTLVKGGPMADILRDPKADPPRCKRTSEEVIGAVIKQHNAIGFVRAHCQFTLDARVRALGIAKDSQSPPVLPSPNTIADGSYPATDNLTLYLHPDAPPVAQEFCEFATGPEGVKIIRQFG